MRQLLRSFPRRAVLVGAVLTLLSSHRSLAQAANDDCAQAVPVTVTTSACSAPVNGTVEGATQATAPGPPCAGTATVANDVWYTFVPASSSVQIILSPRFAAAMELRSGTCASSALLGCTSVAANNTNPRQYAGLTSGQTYLIRIYPGTATPPAAGISSTFTLCVGAGANTPPANDECTNAVPIPIAASCATPVSGTLLLATQSLAPTASCRNTSTTANDVWYSFTATGTSQNITFTAAFLTYFEVRQGTCASSGSVFCSAASSGQTTTINGLTNGQTYFLRVYAGFLSATTDPNFLLCLTDGPPPPANDECSNAIPLTVTNNCVVPVNGTVAGATQSVGPTAGCNIGSSTGTTVANDVWYSFVATGSSQIINATGQPLSFVLDIRTGTCASSTSLFCERIGSVPLVPTGLTAGQTYFIRIYPNSPYPQLPGQAAFTLCLNNGPSASANDECSTAVAVAVVADCANSTNGTVYNATPSLPTAASCGSTSTPANDVWYSFTASGPTQTIALTTRFPAVLEIRSGACASTAPVFCATRTALDDAFIASGLTAGQPYFIRIYANGTTPTVTNASFTLCLTQAPTPPANDECAGAVLVPVGATCAAPVSGTLAAASQSLPSASSGCGVGLANDVWYRFVATTTSHLVTLSSTSNLAVDVRSGTCAGSASLGCSLYSAALPTRLITGLTVGQAYYLRVYGGTFIQPAAAANFTLCVTTPPTTGPANDDCAGAIALPINATCVPVTGTVAAATQSLPAGPCSGGIATAFDVWYSFVAASPAQSVTVSTALLNYIVEVYSGSCASPTPLVCGNTFNPLQATGLTLGQTYFIRVYPLAFGAAPTGSAASFTICLAAAPANDEPCGAVALPLSAAGTPIQPVAGSTIGATTSTQPVVLPATCTATRGVSDVWYSFTPGVGVTSVRLVFTGVGANTLRLFTAANCAAGPLTQVGCRVGGSATGSLGSVVLPGLVPGQLYYVAVSDNGFDPTLGPFTIAGASITASRPQADTEALVVYPNPSNTGQLTLRLSSAPASSQATLLNALGQVVRRKTWPAGATEQQLTTHGLATGVYTLRMLVGNTMLTRKVVLE